MEDFFELAKLLAVLGDMILNTKWPITLPNGIVVAGIRPR